MSVESDCGSPLTLPDILSDSYRRQTRCEPDVESPYQWRCGGGRGRFTSKRSIFFFFNKQSANT